MWEEWRKANGKFHLFVHKKWGKKNFIDISRNLSRFGKLSQDTQPHSKTHKGDGGAVSNMSNVGEGIGGELNPESEVGESNLGVLIDEKEVLSVLLQQVEDCNKSDSEDDDEADNIYSKLEVKTMQDRDLSDADKFKLDSDVTAPCGFCKRICFCSPGVRVKRPFVLTGFNSVDDSVSEPKRVLDEAHVKQEALACLATKCSEKLGENLRNFSKAAIKSRFSERVELMYGSINESFHFAEQLVEAASSTKSYNSPQWSEEQTGEILAVETMQDLFHNHYASPYEGEDTLPESNQISGLSSNQVTGFSSLEFLENY